MDNTENNLTEPEAPPPKSNAKLKYWLTLALPIVVILIALLFVFKKTSYYIARKVHATKVIQHPTQKDFQTELEQIKHQIEQQQIAIIATQTNLQAISQRNHPHYWQINEAQYLTQLAAWNLVINQNVKLALQLLTAANQRLSALANPTLLPLQQSLMNDIQQLKNTTVPSLPDVLLKIDTLREQIEKAPIISTIHLEAPAKKETTSSTSAWKQTLQTSFDTLKKAVIIRKHPNQIAMPLIAPEQQSLLKQNIAFQLSILQWAIVNHQPAIYHNRLHVIKAWLEQYFVQNAQTTQSALRTLDTLNKINLTPTLPNLSNSLNLFHQVANGQPMLEKPQQPQQQQPLMPTEPQVLPS